MSKAETPPLLIPVRKARKCDSCHFFMSDLDPHPECSKCLPRSCCLRPPLPGYVEEMGALADRQKRGESVRGGGGKQGW